MLGPFFNWRVTRKDGVTRESWYTLDAGGIVMTFIEYDERAFRASGSIADLRDRAAAQLQDTLSLKQKGTQGHA